MDGALYCWFIILYWLGWAGRDGVERDESATLVWPSFLVLFPPPPGFFRPASVSICFILYLLDQKAVWRASFICFASRPIAVVFRIMYASIFLRSGSHCIVRATSCGEESQCDRPAVACPKRSQVLLRGWRRERGGWRGGGAETKVVLFPFPACDFRVYVFKSIILVVLLFSRCFRFCRGVM